MESYSSYSKNLDLVISNHPERTLENTAFHLNGGASFALKELIDIETIKNSGAFFTPISLAEQTVAMLSYKQIENGILDPSCGAGDLLIRCSEKLPIHDTLSKTLGYWGEIIGGYDIHQEFIDVAKKRLVLCALSRGCINDLNEINYSAIFPKIIKKDFFEVSKIETLTNIVMNPPFNQVTVDKEFEFSSGRVSLAGLFIDHFLNISNSNQNYVAILPDVIRSGTRYKKLRAKIEQKCKINTIEIKGRFSTDADVDVFIVAGELSNNDNLTFAPAVDNDSLSISDLASVRVGSVVPHRDREEGEIVDYYTAKDIPNLSPHFSQRKVKSTTFTPPFIAVRRTSSPSDKKRIIASIIEGKNPVALENHLIAVIPHDSRVATCKKILATLSTNDSVDFLNNQIRCRHLTVTAIKNIPL